MDITSIISGIDNVEKPIICSDLAELYRIRAANFKQYELLEAQACASGFVSYNKRYEGDVVFSTYVKENHALYLSYTPSEQCIRLISKENAILPEKKVPSFEKKVNPLITQVRTAYFSMDCGMSYVIRVSDGRFILIDGGAVEYEEADHLWDVLMSQYEGKDKPVIAAWFITHPHDDHFGGFVQFMSKYREQVTLERVLYNWGASSMSPVPTGMNDLTEFNGLIESLGDTIKVITPRTGQRFVFADAIFDILFVCEDLYPEKITDINNTSLAMRMEIAGRRVLCIGDMSEQGADLLCKRYSEDTLRCEIYQVGHHGYYGGSDELHRKVDPKVLLWPCPNFWFPVVRLWNTNEYLITSPNVHSTIVAGQGEMVLDMTQPIEAFQPYRLVKEGEVVYEEHFEGNRVIDLHWSCITGGHTGYHAAKAHLAQGECSLKTVDANSYTVCEFVQPGQMELAKDFTLTLSGRLEKDTEEFGLFWDYPSPTIFSEEHALWLKPAEDGNFSYRLVADSKKQKAQLYLYDTCICELPYETRGGLYFILKNGGVTLTHIQVLI